MSCVSAPRLSRFALVGVPNCGKTALFNRLTGSRQKVANYPGVTVERKEGAFATPTDARQYRSSTCPAPTACVPTTLDEAITRDAVTGRLRGEAAPDLIVCVVDATNLRLSLRLALELQRVRPADDRGAEHERPRAAARLSSSIARGWTPNWACPWSRPWPCIRWRARAGGGDRCAVRALDASGRSAQLRAMRRAHAARRPRRVLAPVVVPAQTSADIERTQREVRRILRRSGYVEPLRARALARLDAIVMHPVAGPLLLAVLLFLMFQAVFSWARLPMAWINAGMGALGAAVQHAMPPGPLHSLLVDGVIKGAGSVLVFLPQILILFFFILLLEDSGYLPRAAFLLDRLMGSIGLSGRSFIPLLSSFACAIPGIMATRTIPNLRDRLATILLAPLMTCSARLPVYALIIGAFIPERSIGWLSICRAWCCFALYVPACSAPCWWPS